MHKKPQVIIMLPKKAGKTPSSPIKMAISDTNAQEKGIIANNKKTILENVIKCLLFFKKTPLSMQN